MVEHFSYCGFLWLCSRASHLLGAALLFVSFGLPQLVLAFNKAAGEIQQPAQSGQRQDLEALARTYRAKLQLKPDDETTVFPLADIYIALGKLGEAEALLEEHLRRNPDSAGTLYRLGRVLFDRHDWAASAHYLLRSLKINLQNDRAHLLLGLNFFQMNQLEAAEGELLIAVKQNPQSDENHYMAGRLFYTKGRIEDAIFHFYQAIRLNPQHFKAHHSLGLCFTSFGHYPLAENYYKRAIRLAEGQSMNFAQGYLDLAELLTRIESVKVAEGEVFARRAKELAPDSSEAHFLVGKALYRQGRYEEAIPELRKAVRLDPENTKPHFLLARIYKSMGLEAEAKSEWDIFNQLQRAKSSRKSPRHGSQ